MAVLIEWKEYDLCRENIKLAKESGCPEKLIQKLDDRDLKCVSMMEQKKSNKPMKEVKIHVSRCSPIDSMINLVDPLFSCDKYHGDADLSLAANPKMPFAVNCMEMKHESEYGCHIVTKEDLKAGQIVVIETPFVHAPTTKDDTYRYTKCANCYKENFLSLIYHVHHVQTQCTVLKNV